MPSKVDAPKPIFSQLLGWGAVILHYVFTEQLIFSAYYSSLFVFTFIYQTLVQMAEQVKENKFFCYIIYFIGLPSFI